MRGVAFPGPRASWYRRWGVRIDVVAVVPPNSADEIKTGSLRRIPRVIMKYHWLGCIVSMAQNRSEENAFHNVGRIFPMTSNSAVGHYPRVSPSPGLGEV